MPKTKTKPKASTATRQTNAARTTARTNPLARPSKSQPKPKDPKASHLYTDDNPSTTIHGTGFATAPKAHATLYRIARRGPTYHFQLANTLLHRAQHHPSYAKSADMRAGAGVFRAWLADEWPRARDAAARFRPVLGKEAVARWLPGLRARGGVDVVFAEVYVALAKGRQLANVLVDEGEPEGPDWEAVRLERLEALVREGVPSDKSELWDEPGVPSLWHAQCLAWAWKPKLENSK